MADDVVVFIKSDLASSAFPAMEDIRRRGKLCDVTLKVGENKFSAHRIVLAATIPYFNAMFTHDMVESRQSEINVQGIESSALESLINFAYNGRIQLDTSNIQSILIGSSFLQMQPVKDACCDFLRNRLHPKNVLGVRAFSEQFMCPALTDSCSRYLQRHFVDVSKTDDFLALSSKEVSDIVALDSLHVNSEEEVFESVIRWVRHDVDHRSESVVDLLRLVRLPLLVPQYLADHVSQEEVIKKSLPCRDLLDAARDYHLLPERRAQMSTFITRSRCCADVVGLVYAVGGLTPSGDSVSTVEYFDPSVGHWQLSEPMKTLRSRVGIAVLNNVIYAIGGYDGNERLNTVEAFNPVQKSWYLLKPMICKRSALGAVSLGGKLYVSGGYDGSTSLNSVEVYDPATNNWTMISGMERHRSAGALAVLDGLLYAIGGHDGLSIFNSVECYNNQTGVWSQVTPLLSRRCRLGAACINGRLYVAGGYDGSQFLRSVECYDPVTNRWTYVASMNTKRSRVALVASQEKLYAVGGYDGTVNLNTVEVYDPKTDRWTFSAPMIAHEGGVGVGTVPAEPAY